MNRLALRYRLFFTFVVLVAMLLPEATFAQDSIPGIPHSLEGRDACLACHETGAAGATKIPENHAGRTNEMCRACHQPVSSGGEETATPASSPELTPAAGEPPMIPHTVEGPDVCLACHALDAAGVPKIPEDHAGRTNETCRVCHQSVLSAGEETATPSPTPEPTPTTAAGEAQPIPPTGEPQPVLPAGEAQPIPHSLEGMEDCLQCHVSPEATAAPAGGAPGIPHPLVGRDNCLACHQEGIGGAPRIPADHAGRTIDMCQSCHQPIDTTMAPTPAAQIEPVPTPLVYPHAEGVDTCVECHATLGGEQAEVTAKWQHSIHAKRDVSCADCHGGNPAGKTVDEAMSPDAGYIGVPDKATIPALCAGCHSDVTLMRPYDLPTDQYAKYQESIHGIKLAEGDTNVTTCFDCHGGHEILETNDPGSTVYPTNVPKLCAGCHSDEQLMAPYHIPTNQFELYEQSVHGHALIDNQDLRAPSCATCHGTHGAAPPGFEEVANVCGGCHSATQEHYLQSPHAQLGEAGPKCVTCHGRYDVNKPSEAMYLGTEPRHCGSCHSPESEGGKSAQAMYDAITAATDAYGQAEASVQAAADLGMVVATEKNLLREANTDIVTARAVQHTASTDQVKELAAKAQSTSEEVKASADAAVADSFFRRRAMIIAVIAIVLVMGALYLLKRELHRQLEAES